MNSKFDFLQHNSNIQQKYCLACVATQAYMAGLAVMIKSFVRCNTWFNGDIVVITNYIPKNKNTIAGKKIKWLIANNRLKKEMEIVIRRFPELTTRINRLLILQVFLLHDYDFIVYSDIDILHCTELNPGFFNSQKLLVVRDPSYYLGFARHKTSYVKIPIKMDNSNVLPDFFNSGFMVIPNKFSTIVYYRRLVEQLHKLNFREISDSIVDEPVLNAVLGNEIEFLPVQYNSSVHLLVEGNLPNGAANIHFTGKNKPWMFKSWIVLLLRSFKYLHYLIIWLKSYFF